MSLATTEKIFETVSWFRRLWASENFLDVLSILTKISGRLECF